MMSFDRIYDALHDAFERGALWTGGDGRLYIANHPVAERHSCGATLNHIGYRLRGGLPVVMTTCPRCDTYRPEDDR